MNDFIEKLLDDLHNINPELSLEREKEYRKNFVFQCKKSIERPQLKDYLPENVSASNVQKMFGAYSDLYKYIVALDSYIDHLEEDCIVYDKEK